MTTSGWKKHHDKMPRRRLCGILWSVTMKKLTVVLVLAAAAASAFAGIIWPDDPFPKWVPWTTK
jgi:hypothetical protein